MVSYVEGFWLRIIVTHKRSDRGVPEATQKGAQRGGQRELGQKHRPMLETILVFTPKVWGRGENPFVARSTTQNTTESREITSTQ